MDSSAKVALLYRVSELAQRFGLRPSEADAIFVRTQHPDFENRLYELQFNGRPGPSGTDKGDKFDKMMDALGCDNFALRSDDFQCLEDAVERAMHLAPRARSRG